MYRIIKYVVLYMLVFIGGTASAQATISGKVNIDSTWENTVYCSRIQSLDDMYRCSPNMIVGQAEIKSGAFILRIKTPLECQLVRLHVSKKNATAANLIIGGDEENFAFIGIADGDELVLPISSNKLMQNFGPLNALNEQLSDVWKTVQQYEQAYMMAKTPSAKLEESAAFREAMYDYTDRATLVLPSLLALYEAGLSGKDDRTAFHYQKLYDRLGPSPYFPSTFDKAHRGQPIWLMLPILVLGMVSLAYYFLYSFLPKRKLKNLSVQERKVVELINKGLTNKLIAQELNVEVSTVKSHVYRIFNKLNVKSRNELITFQKWMHNSEGSLAVV